MATTNVLTEGFYSTLTEPQKRHYQVLAGRVKNMIVQGYKDEDILTDNTIMKQGFDEDVIKDMIRRVKRIEGISRGRYPWGKKE